MTGVVFIQSALQRNRLVVYGIRLVLRDHDSSYTYLDGKPVSLEVPERLRTCVYHD